MLGDPEIAIEPPCKLCKLLQNICSGGTLFSSLRLQTMDEKPSKTPAKNATRRKQTKRRGRRLTGLSRQRRMANERERTRVHVINESIDRLRDLIPLFPNERKPSKSDTIRLAALYISHLTAILQDDGNKVTTSRQEPFNVEMTDPSLNISPFEDTTELAVYLWKEDSIRDDDSSDIMQVFEISV